jgi:hypothetical protein
MYGMSLIIATQTGVKKRSTVQDERAKGPFISIILMSKGSALINCRGPILGAKFIKLGGWWRTSPKGKRRVLALL